MAVLDVAFELTFTFESGWWAAKALPWMSA
jgi:hypothetical protein